MGAALAAGAAGGRALRAVRGGEIRPRRWGFPWKPVSVGVCRGIESFSRLPGSPRWCEMGVCNHAQWDIRTSSPVNIDTFLGQDTSISAQALLRRCFGQPFLFREGPEPLRGGLGAAVGSRGVAAGGLHPAPGRLPIGGAALPRGL